MQVGGEIWGQMEGQGQKKGWVGDELVPLPFPSVTGPTETGQQKVLVWSPMGFVESPHIQVQPRDTRLASCCGLRVLTNENACTGTHLAEL